MSQSLFSFYTTCIKIPSHRKEYHHNQKKKSQHSFVDFGDPYQRKICSLPTYDTKWIGRKNILEVILPGNNIHTEIHMGNLLSDLADYLEHILGSVLLFQISRKGKLNQTCKIQTLYFKRCIQWGRSNGWINLPQN